MTSTLGDNLARALRDVLAARPDRHFHFPALGRSLSYPELGQAADAVTNALRARGVRAGERVGLLFNNSPEFVAAFAGVLAAGAVAVSLPHPGGARALAAYVERLKRILLGSDVRYVLSGDEFTAYGAQLVQSQGLAVQTLETKQLIEEHRGETREPAVQVVGTDLALVQYTSGSTAAPKGVALTHANLMASLHAIQVGIELTDADVNGQWLPLHHDMGLVGMLAGTLAGVTHHLTSPTTFIRNPARWLLEFSRYRGTIYAGPSFSYASMLRKVTDGQLAELDLRSWRVAFNGAEVIDADVLERFAERFGSVGFARSTMFPVYGLAEATLAVAFPRLGSEPRTLWADGELLANTGRLVEVARDVPRARGLVSVGRAVFGHEIRIADQDGRSLPEGCAGEIEVRGPATMRNYLGLTQAESGVREDDWVRTGDLGVLQRDELFVAGRIKEMIIVRGAKFYPFDVEGIARKVDGVHGGNVIAFAAQDGVRERMVVTAELAAAAEPSTLIQQLREAVLSELGLSELEVVLVKARSLPRTTSGKFQRVLVRERHRAGDLADVVMGG
jgi:fatty-acyl-CoA synthase